jgi:hydroxyacylglutathione hydrolase
MSEIKLQIVPVGALEANCYILWDSTTREGIIVDPGSEASKIVALVKKNNLLIKYIINTHGHYDHIGANQELRSKLGAEILIHEADGPLLENPMKNLSFLKPAIRNVQLTPDRLLKEGDIITVGAISLEVIHTPGHTQGSICLLGDNFIITGDTLFEGSIGRTDLPGGSYDDIQASLKDKLQTLSDDLVVYPGHGPATTIGQEKLNNPFLHTS